jgi:DNA-directed RNA polymerase sigma subunit (sigma70/sigma32)
LQDNLAVSLNGPLSGDNEDFEWADSLPDTSFLRPDQIMEAKDELVSVRKQLASLIEAIDCMRLTDRNKSVFRGFYGIGGDYRKRTLQELGDEFGVSRERIRQILLKVWIKASKATGLAMDGDWLRATLRRLQLLEEIAAMA